MRCALNCGIFRADETEEWSCPFPAWQSDLENHGSLRRRSKAKPVPRDGQHSNTGIADRALPRMAVLGIQNTSDTFRSPAVRPSETESYQNSDTCIGQAPPVKNPCGMLRIHPILNVALNAKL